MKYHEKSWDVIAEGYVVANMIPTTTAVFPTSRKNMKEYLHTAHVYTVYIYIYYMYTCMHYESQIKP